MNVSVDVKAKPFDPLIYCVGWNNLQLLSASAKFRDEKCVSTPQESLLKFGDSNLEVSLMATGGSHSLIYTEDKRLFGFGRNFYGQLGTGNTEDSISLKEVDLSKLEEGDEIVSLDCGDRHSAFVTKKGRCFVFGCNGNGQLGIGQQSMVTSPEQVMLLMNKRIVKVVCGARHTIFVTKSGAMFSTGMGSYGQLGNGENKDVIFPVAVEKDAWKILDLKANEYLNIALSDDYSVYVWGGQLFKEGRDQGSSEAVNVPRKVCQNLLGRRVVGIAAGANYYSVLTTDGSVFIFGNSLAGAGYMKFLPGITNCIKKFSDPDEQDKHLTDVERQWKNTLDLSRKYIVPSELCTNTTFYKLQFLPSDDPVVQVAIGNSVTYLVTEGGKLWVFGEAKFNELALGDEVKEALKPEQVQTVNDAFIPHVVAGNWHAFFLTGSYANFKLRHLNHGQQLPKTLERMEEKIRSLTL